MTGKLKHGVQVIVEYFTGFEKGEDDTGRPYFVAHSDDLRFTTDGKTFEQLLGDRTNGNSKPKER